MFVCTYTLPGRKTNAKIYNRVGIIHYFKPGKWEKFVLSAAFGNILFK